MSDRKNGFVPCHPFHHHLNPHPLDEKNCAMPPFHHHLNPHPLDEKNMPGGGGWGGYGGGRVAWHNVILSDVLNNFTSGLRKKGRATVLSDPALLWTTGIEHNLLH